MLALILAERLVARKYVSLNIGELVVPPKVIIFGWNAFDCSSKVTMTTILSQPKAGPWKRDVEKTKGTDSIL